MNEQLPKSIKKRLRALLRRVRRLQLARGIMGVATVALGGVLAVMAVDFFLAPVPAIARWAMFVLLVAGLGVAAYTWLWKPLVRRISLVQVARWIETRHPEIEERISTAVELSGSEAGVSEELLHELIMAAEGDVEAVDPEVEVRSRRAKRWMYPAAGLAAVLAVLFVIWPGETGRLLVRAVAPFSAVGNAGAVWFEIDPGDMEVMEGDEVKITIKYDGPRTEALTLVVGREGAEVIEETLAVARVEDGKREFHYRLPLARESFTYHARVRKAQSDQHRVKVYPLPRLEAVTVDYQYPGYTGRAPHERQLGRAVEALAGTEVRLQGVPNTPVESGKFLIDGKEFGAVKIEAGAAGGRAEVAWRLMPGESGLGQVMVTHRLGREVEALRFPVKVRLDEPPKVEVVAPVQRDLRVRPDELITIEYEVEEDVDLAAAAIEMRVNGKSVPALPEVLPERDHSDKRKLWRGEALVYVGSLLDDFEKAREVKMRLAVTDVLPADLDGPGVGYSEWLTIRIDRQADSLVRQEIRAQQSDARETIEEAMRDVTEAKQKMDANRHAVKKEELPKHTEKQFAEAREKLAAAEAALDQLAERMEHGVQAAKADEVREAADSAKEAREHLENTPLQDTPEGREAELDEGRQAAQEAMEALQELRDQVNRDEQKLQELARLSELAQQEREVARQAERRAEQEGAETPADPQLQQQQRQIQQQLEQQMRQNPETAAEMLERQAERARELAERAEELSARQEGLAQEMEQRAQDAPRQEPGQEAAAEARAAEAEQRMAEALQEQLQQEQENIVREAQARMAEARQNREERADLLPEAIGEAQEALEAMKKSEPQAAAEAAQAAAETMENLAKGSEERAAKPEADGGEGEVAQESSGETPGQESGEQAAGESGEKPDAGGEGEMAQESSGEKPGQEGGEQAAGESGEKPGGSGEGEMAQESSGEKPGQEGGEQAAGESGEKPGGSGEGEMAQESSGEKPGQEGGGQAAGESGEKPGGSGEGEMAQESSGEAAPGGERGQPGNAGDEPDADLADLAERQEAVAQALEALGAGQTGEAMQAVQEMQAQDAADLADAIEAAPQVNGQSGNMAQAAGQAQRGEQAAQQAAQQGQQGTPQGAAQKHGQASEAFAQAAQALQRAAAEFEQGAQQAGNREMNPNQLALPAEAMANALEAAAEAGRAQSSGKAAQASQEAAQALSQAAQQAMQGMKSGMPPGQPGQPGEPGDMPGDDPQEGVRPGQADPGVPPQLAELGVSAEDWEKLQALLRSDVGGAAGAAVPDDYRGLVRQYFEQVAKGAKR